MVQKSTKKNRCKECRCKPCKCREGIHCYHIMCPSCNNKRKKTRRRTTQKGGYPFWFDDVPKGMSRDQYKRLEKSKPKNKSMKVWIRENKKNMKKYTKKISKKRSPKKKYTKKRGSHGRGPERWKNSISSSRKSQRGGFCPPCLIAPLITATGLGGAAFAVSKSSSVRTKNGKTVSKRKESYEIKKNGKKIKKIYEQKNNKIFLNGKEIKPRPKTTKEATKQLNQKIKECVESGFKKC
jgi:hypothetical protein